MNIVTAITLRNRRDQHQADQLEEPLFRTRGPKQRAPCWSDIDKTAMLDTALRGFTCGPIYIIKDLEEGIEDVFDGAHRCEALFEFIDNKYPITKGKKDTINWNSSPLKDYVGKYFKDIPKDLQDKVKKYPFSINVIDPETAEDSDALQMLWERLSKAGKPLNNYETKNQTHTILQKEVLEYSVIDWLKSPFIQQDKSNRGHVEVKLNKLLALSESEEVNVFGSMEDLVSKWCEAELGKGVKEIDENTRNKKDELNLRLKNMRSILRELEDKNIFHDKEGNIDKDVNHKSREVPLLIILGRLGYWFPSVSKVKRSSIEICTFISDILKMNPNDLCKLLGVNSRNATFQKALIRYVDQKFREIKGGSEGRRLFTPAEKDKKLEEQGGKCAICNEKIHNHQRREGDHVMEYCLGGKTNYDNLQVVHKLCHEQKNIVAATR
jgi:CII-binding regulator of phage lambda lysogenization HflD